MTGTLILLGFLALLVAALELSERRTGRRWRPGSDLRNDRDAARTDDELRALEQADRALASELPALARSVEPDARITREAA